ncbi:MAG: cell surface protein, partial [Myxococcaceae bacterium]
DGFDLAAVGLTRARFVRIRDSGANGYAGTSGGFDLDAVAVVNGVQLP